MAYYLSALAVRLEAKDAVIILVQTMNNTKDPDALSQLTRSLSAVGIGMQLTDPRRPLPP